MAKKKESETLEAVKDLSDQIKGKLSQRERNLLLKKEMIAKGERPAPTSQARTQHEKNLEKKTKAPDEKESTPEKGKGKGKA